jgi:tetratricopeptide (TPR) repeat protein
MDAHPREPLKVTFAGCAAVVRGPVCQLADASRLVLWVEGPVDGHLAVSVDGRQVQAEAVAGEDGWTVAASVPADAGLLELVSGARRFQLVLHPQASCPGVARARELAVQGELKEALGHLEQPDSNPLCRGRNLGLRARLAMNQDQTDEAVGLFRESLARHKLDGNLSRQVEDGTALAHALLYKVFEFQGARKVLRDLSEPAVSYGEGRILLPYFRGQIAREAGDLREALRLFGQAATWAERLQAQDLRAALTQERADLLQVLGRNTEAGELLERLLTRSGSRLVPCSRADMLVNVGWLRLLRREEGDALEPESVLIEALGIYRSECPQPADEANVLVNLALAAIQGGRMDEAEARLQMARAVQDKPDPLVASWLQDLTGRIALARSQPAIALQAYEAMHEAAPVFSQEKWRACLGRAISLLRLGSLDKALEVFWLAEGQLDEQIRLIPMGAGRGAFLRDREQAARHLVDLLLRKGKIPQAVAAARRSRARVLWTMAGAERVSGLSGSDRIAWEDGLTTVRRLRGRLEEVEHRLQEAALDEQPSLESTRLGLEEALRAALDRAYLAVDNPLGRELPISTPSEGSLLLLYHPLPEGWAAFAVTRTDAAFNRIPRLPSLEDRAGLARVLLEPFAAQIDAAERIHIMVYGPLERVDFHALPWRGAVLVSQVPVAYALDLPGPVRDDARTLCQALVVIDPQGNLRAARRTAGEILAALEMKSCRVRVLRGLEASHRAVSRELASARVFFFAGHARMGGREGWESHLLLAGGYRFGIPEILAAPVVPRQVVLAACESARTDEDARVQTLGLGQAFVMAGSSEVVAAARPLDDDTAGRLSTAIFAQLDEDLGRALRSAQLQLRRECPGCDWAACRVLVP